MAYFVDVRATTQDHIDELKIPLAQGVITRDDVIAELSELVTGHAGRTSRAVITVCKSGAVRI